MSHSLSETAAWAPTVTVPDAPDDGQFRHVALQVPAQALANRTAYLKAQTDNSVKVSGVSSQSIAGSLSVSGDLTVGGTHVTASAADATFKNITASLHLSADTLTTAGDLIAGGSIGAGGDLGCVGSIEAAGDITTTGGDIILPAGKRVKYSSPVAQLRRVRMAAGTSPQPVSAVAFDGGKWSTFNTAYIISIPLPQYSSLTEVSAVWLRYAASGANGTVELIRHAIGDWLVSPGGATPTVTSLGSATLTTSGAGIKTAIITLGTPLVISNSSDDYFIRITGSASSTHDIHGAALTVKLYSPGID